VLLPELLVEGLDEIVQAGQRHPLGVDVHFDDRVQGLETAKFSQFDHPSQGLLAAGLLRPPGPFFGGAGFDERTMAMAELAGIHSELRNELVVLFGEFQI
jgi:hypothetical protein